MRKGFGLNLGVDAVEEEVAEKKSKLQGFLGEGKGAIDREQVLKAVDMEVPNQLSRNSSEAKKGRVGAKEKQWGTQAQINWKTYEAQKRCVDNLVKQTGLKKADVFNAALALAMKLHESGGDLKSVELKFTKE